MADFLPSTDYQVLLVTPEGVPYKIGETPGEGTFNPSDTARIVLVTPEGIPYTA